MSSIADPASESLLQQRPFCFFSLARVASTLALQMQVVAVGWQIYQMTGSAFNLGMIGLVQFVPSLFLVFVVGTVADRYDRRVVLLLCVLLEASCSLLLGVGSAGGWLSAELIFVAVFLIGIGRAFSAPLMQVPRAIAAFASVTQIAIIVGLALGGLLYLAGPGAVYFSSFAMFILSAVLVWMVRINRPVKAKPAVTLKSLFAGIAFIRSKPAVMGAISLDLFAVLLGGATALLPIYAHDILHTDSVGLGMLRSAPAIGALTIGLLLARYPLRNHVGRIMFAADMISVVIRSAFVQLQTPDEMRGRVNSVNSVFIGTSNQLGEFESGVTAAWLGTVPAVVLGGLGTLFVVGLWIKLFPDLYKVDRLVAAEDAKTS